jgi:hypothetical protein
MNIVRLKLVVILIHSLFLCILGENLCFGNDYTITYEIEHPKLSYEHTTPLIIEMHWTGTETFTEKIVSYPFMHIFYNRNGDIEHKGSWMLYQDAFKYPDGKGIVLVTKRTGYESDPYFDSIEIFYQHSHGYIKEPKGSKLYWTKDGEFLVIVSFPSPYGDDVGPIKLFYYKHSELIKIEDVSNYTEFERLEFVKAN